MDENAISRVILDAAFKVHSVLGPGLLESVYEVTLAHEIRKAGLGVERQVAIPVQYDGIAFEEGFRADLIVGQRVLVELKAAEKILPVHGKQVLSYLRLTHLKLGLLINFNVESLREGIKRVANNLK